MASLTDLETKLAAAEDALESALKSQSYRSGPFQKQNQEIKGLKEYIQYLEGKIAVVRNKGRVPGSSVVFGGHRG
jgi:peptidoglycan hydrolase CwlO-like protein